MQSCCCDCLERNSSVASQTNQTTTAFLVCVLVPLVVTHSLSVLGKFLHSLHCPPHSGMRGCVQREQDVLCVWGGGRQPAGGCGPASCFHSSSATSTLSMIRNLGHLILYVLLLFSWHSGWIIFQTQNLTCQVIIYLLSLFTYYLSIQLTIN